jgi:hypothetical protein
MTLAGETRITRRKNVTLQIRLPQISHGPTWGPKRCFCGKRPETYRLRHGMALKSEINLILFKDSARTAQKTLSFSVIKQVS